MIKAAKTTTKPTTLIYHKKVHTFPVVIGRAPAASKRPLCQTIGRRMAHVACANIENAYAFRIHLVIGFIPQHSTAQVRLHATALCMWTSLTTYPFAAQVRLQQHYVHVPHPISLCSTGAVTTALCARHSRFSPRLQPRPQLSKGKACALTFWIDI